MYIAYVNYSVHNLRKISFTCPLSALLPVYGKPSSVYVSVCIQERSSSEPPAIRLFIKINLLDRSTICLQR